MAMKVVWFLLLISVFTTEACPGHEIQIYNGCPFAVWPGVFSTINPETNTGFKLDPYQSRSIQVPCKWTSGRIWARTDCDAAGTNCLTGDCGGLACQGAGFGDASLAEFTMDGGSVAINPPIQDTYDISAVDGFNVPISIAPVNGAKTGGDGRYDCIPTQCKHDFRNNCHDQLKEVKNGQVQSCLSACKKFDTDWHCCRKAFDKPETCTAAKNDPLVHFFKQQCPDMYSFAYDDHRSTFTCQGGRGTKYVVSFCPA